MSKALIIVESPAKVKTINKILGAQYRVEASIGHVRDLPQKGLGVDEKADFAPDYEIIAGKDKVVKLLRDAAAKASAVYLAPDPDREGEAIAWHLAELIRDKNPHLQRIQFNEISAPAIREALEHPRDLNRALFDSQQARRILDRLVGYKISPLLWKKVQRGISAGRVQSVTLRLVVDREKERQSFVPEEYWDISAILKGPDKSVIKAELLKIDGKKAKISSAEQADALEQKVRTTPFVVSKVEEKERTRQPVPPFITSSLQQAASQRFGYSTKKTMTTAQRLYEGVDLGERGVIALITYMRTDSVRVSEEALSAARKLIAESFSPEYLPATPRRYAPRSKAQDAHEAIRPVDPSITPDQVKNLLPKDMYSLYSIIWERFVASQMAPAKFWDTTVSIDSGEITWRAKGERLLFDGFLRLSKSLKEATLELPELKAGQTLDLKDILKEQKFTQPKPRYTEAALVREMEELGIGRPSTYASTISTLLDRKYCRLEEKHLVPTDLGVTVSEQLSAHFKDLMDTAFTARMETDLDQVAEGQEDWVSLLKKFTAEFYPTLKQAQQDMAEVKAGLDTDIICDKCGKPMLVKFGRTGPFLACSGYPDCTNTSDFTRDEQGHIQPVARKEAPVEKCGVCPDCGQDLILKKTRTGSRFIACSAYPKCKHAEPFSTGVPCPEPGCSGVLVERSSRYGKIFYSCSRYPECTKALWYWPVEGPCPECGEPLLVKKNTKTRGPHIACSRKGCKYHRPDDGQ